MAKPKVYVWIGDDGDNKSVSIERVVYSKNSEIPADKVDPSILATWIERGLVSEGGILIVSGEAAGLEAEIKALKKENATITAALERAQKGKKAHAVKALEAQIKECEQVGLERGQKIDELESDVREKAALIEKYEARISELEAEVEALEVEALTEPGGDDSDTGGGAGPGGLL